MTPMGNAMKNPLSYQRTEYDCGPTTLLNAMSFLFRRREIPPDIIRYITLYCLDAYNGKGESGKNGTSQMAMMFLSEWLNQFGRAKKFPIRCEYLTREEVWIGGSSRIVAALQQGGAVVVRIWYGCWHYVLLTGADEDSIRLFDPYYRKRAFRREGLALIEEKPCSSNRRVSYALLNSREKSPYALGPKETREAILLFNRSTQIPSGAAIEYFI
jgi:hypothetical protein